MKKRYAPDPPRTNTIEKVQVPEVYQYCDKCKTETVHKKVTGVKKLTLDCINCKANVK